MVAPRSGYRLEPLLSQEQIAQGVKRLADQIRGDYQGTTPHLVAVLKGAFMFLADLVRRLEMPLTLDFIRLHSYQGTESTGTVRLVQGLRTPLRDRDVLVVEDIIDTGLTTTFLLDYLRQRRPRSLRVCALLDKPSRRRVPVPIDYLGFTVPNRFVVGYGIDKDEGWRYLPDIYVIEETPGGA